MTLRSHLSAAACAIALFGSTAHAADPLLTGAPADNFTVTDAVTGLNQPTSFTWLPDGRMLITQKTGELVLVDKAGAKQTVATLPVNTVSEQGLLHVILHPQFATNGLLFFYYSAAASAGGTDADRNRVVSVPFNVTTNKLDMTNEKILVRGLHGPANHDGGSLAIGPDGMLYIGDGDSGNNSNKSPLPPYTPTNFYATCLTVPNGKILRINLDGSIPQDNPLVGAAQVTACSDNRNTDVTTLPLAPAAQARTDIWAMGFRNPWRFWFDSKTKNLWVGDVGEVTYEEIDVIPPSGKGKHFGWPYREGGELPGQELQGHDPTTCTHITPNPGNCVDPQYTCKHGASNTPGLDGNCEAVMGGLIVDSCTWPAAFRGMYFYGDNADRNNQGWVATLQPTADRNGIVAGSRKMFINSTGGPDDFELGPDGDLYYSAVGGGFIEHVAPKTPIKCTLSAPDSGAAGATGGGGSSGATGAAGASGATGSSGTTGTGSGGTGPNGGAAGPGRDASQNGSLDGGNKKGATSGDKGSCGCRTVAQDSSTSRGLLGGAALALLLGRRNRRQGRAR